MKIKSLLLVLLMSGCQINNSSNSVSTSSTSSFVSTSENISSSTLVSNETSSSNVITSSSEELSTSSVASSSVESSSSNEVSSSSSSSVVSSSTSSSEVSSSTSSIEEEYEDNLKEGLKGREWLEYYSSPNVMGCESIPSIGSPNILVAPVLFKNEPIDNSKTVLNDIDLAFNGKSEDTSFESVNSFYKKSSYNKLDMKFDVLDYWITLDKTCTELASLSSTRYADPTWYAVDYVVNYLKENNVDLKQYDTDKDGYIDGIWLVYGKDYSSATSKQEEILWAYTYWTYENTPNVNSPTSNVYGWASVEFMYEGGYSKVDAHTFIHETGHMLGLDDYYDYDSNSTISPAGCLDMMDYNIGDHNAYSKYLLGWIEPTYVTKDVTLTIDSFESSGDSIIVPASLLNDKSPLDEYLIIEYYTPTGLNESDSKNKYLGSYPLLFTKNGVKIYHVDSRIGELEYTYDVSYGDYVYNYSFDDLVSKTDYNTYFGIFASNTSSYSYKSSYKLLNLLSSNKDSINNYYYSNTSASNKDLYDVNDEITSFKFNNGSTLEFNIIIDDISSEGATIIFERK